MNYEQLKLHAASSDHGTRILTELEPAIRDALARTAPRFPVLEIGNREGGSGSVLLYHMALEGKGRRFITVDVIEGPPRLGQVSAELGVEWVHNRREQKDWVKDNKEIFGFMFLDAEHNQGAVQKDMRILAPYLATGGVMVVDDTNDWKDPIEDFADAGLEEVDYGMKAVDPSNLNHVRYWKKAV